MQFHLEYPIALLALLLVAAFGILMWIQKNEMPGTFSWRRFVCVLGGLTFCVLGLSRPQLGRQVTENHAARSNLFLAIDVSRSMLAQDVPPSRLEFATAFAQKLLERLSTVKVALFPFAVEGFIMMPLTADVSAMSDMLSSLSPILTTSQGTDITGSLELLFRNIARMQKNAEGSGIEWFPTQVVLFSDGESHVPIKENVLNEYRARHIPILTVGTGSTAGSTIPIENRYGQSFEGLKDAQGKTVVTHLVPTNLKRISELTGGDYFSAKFEEVNGLSERLLQSMRFGKTATSFKLDKEYYPFLFFLAFLFFFTEFLGGRWNYTIRISFLFFSLVVPFVSAVAESDKNAPTDLEDATSAVKSYNAAVKASEQKNLPKAAELFQESALLTQDKVLKKKALFNLGDTLIKLSDPSQALPVLQQAFDLNSGEKSFDKKTNKDISDNMALAAKLVEQQQRQSGNGDGDGESKDPSKAPKDPKGPQKNYQGQLFSDPQKQRIFDLISSDEQQTLQRLNEQKNKNKNSAYQDKPW